MWRLKIAEGGNDPNIYSTNNFLGRQTWEFDPDAGTLEERAEVEEARQNFWKNRNVVKPSSDLLWKFQVHEHTHKFTAYVFLCIYKSYVSIFSYFHGECNCSDNPMIIFSSSLITFLVTYFYIINCSF